MAICAANMLDCDKKAKCIFGPNEGVAYNPKDPCCGAGEFDPTTCDCLVSWMYYEAISVGACYQFGLDSVTSLCPDSQVENRSIHFVGRLAEGDPVPFFPWETTSHFGENIGGTYQSQTGTATIGEQVTAELAIGLSSTSQISPFSTPSLVPGVQGDGSTCTQQFSNCGSVREGDFVAYGTVTWLSWSGPEEGQCDGLTDQECFDQFGPQ